MKIQKVRGTRDILYPESDKFSLAEAVIRKVFEKYSYTEIRTPTFEETGLFKRTIGEVTDIVEKEMYSFKDKKGRDLTLRPEGTAGVVRAYIENGLQVKSKISRLYYIGRMFRYERPQDGRYREFSQAGIELFGEEKTAADIEVIMVASEALSLLGAGKCLLKINFIGCGDCRKKMKENIVSYFSGYKNNLCEDCVRRVENNPLRLLDCKNSGCRQIVSGYFEGKNVSGLCEKCSSAFCSVTEALSRAGEEYLIDSRLVRGLDYYTGTVFEFVDPAGLAIAAGGRYDGLVSSLGGGNIPATGFAFGVDRLVNFINTGENSRKKMLIAVSDAGWEGKIHSLLKTARPENIVFEFAYGIKNFSKLFSHAAKNNYEYVMVLGENELKAMTVSVKNMKTGKQSEIPIGNGPQFLEEFLLEREGLPDDR